MATHSSVLAWRIPGMGVDGAIIINSKHLGQNGIDDDIGLARQFDGDVVPLAGFATVFLQEEHQERTGTIHGERSFDVRPIAFAIFDMHHEIFGTKVFVLRVMKIEADDLYIIIFQ